MKTWSVRIAHPCGRIVAGPGWGRDRMTSLRLRDQELWLVWAGRGRMQTRAGDFELHPGFCAWMRPGGIYDAQQDDSRPLGISYIHFNMLNAQGLELSATKLKLPEFFDLGRPAYVDEIMRRIIELAGTSTQKMWGRPAAGSGEANVLLQGLLSDLANHAIHHGMVTGSNVSKNASPSERRRRQVLDQAARMRENPAETFSVITMARQWGVSSAHYSRFFRRVMGQSPQYYAVNCRIERAKQMLIDSDFPVSRVATIMGYQDVYFFSRQFKQWTGQSPSLFRDRFQNRST